MKLSEILGGGAAKTVVLDKESTESYTLTGTANKDVLLLSYGDQAFIACPESVCGLFYDGTNYFRPILPKGHLYDSSPTAGAMEAINQDTDIILKYPFLQTVNPTDYLALDVSSVLTNSTAYYKGMTMHGSDIILSEVGYIYVLTGETATVKYTTNSASITAGHSSMVYMDGFLYLGFGNSENALYYDYDGTAAPGTSSSGTEADLYSPSYDTGCMTADASYIYNGGVGSIYRSSQNVSGSYPVTNIDYSVVTTDKIDNAYVDTSWLIVGGVLSSYYTKMAVDDNYFYVMGATSYTHSALKVINKSTYKAETIVYIEELIDKNISSIYSDGTYLYIMSEEVIHKYLISEILDISNHYPTNIRLYTTANNPFAAQASAGFYSYLTTPNIGVVAYGA